jgi:molecular chaperone GrpE
VTQAEQTPNGEEPRVVVRDRRRIDPETGAVRTPDPTGPKHAAPETPEPSGPAGAAGPAGASTAPTADGAGAGDSDGAGELRNQLAERTSDLQRITAEYANYRRRVERDREAVVVAAKATVVAELLPVLDDLERAKAHGDLTGAFKAVADKLTATLEKVGLTAFGSEGDEFNPVVHQAVQHSTSPDVAGPTVTAGLRRGYQLGERLLRTAMVAVTDHEPAPSGSTSGTASDAVADQVADPAPDAAADPVAAQASSTAESGVDAPLQAGPAVDHSPAQRDQS